jgi:hypothetical protein
MPDSGLTVPKLIIGYPNDFGAFAEVYTENFIVVKCSIKQGGGLTQFIRSNQIVG